MARAATAGEIIKFRADGNASRLFAIFDVPVPVFIARINQTFTTHDMVAQLAYDTVSFGAVASAIYGMTVLISTALPAAPDNTIGMTYVRKTASASPLYTGETSEIPYADNLYITVLDEFGCWQDHIRVMDSGAAFIRYDTPYSDQHTNFDPTPIIGSDRAARLSGASTTLNFSASSYMIDGTTIASHLWVFSGASGTSGLTTSTPTATYNACGRYKAKYTVTAANGKSRTTWRDIYIYDDSHLIAIDPILASCDLDWDSGGLEFGLTILQDATTSAVRDRTKVLLIEEASYGGATGSIGALAGAENIVAAGWLDDETVTLDPIRGEISFTVKAANYWLDKENAFILGYKNTNDVPAAWTDIFGLTPDFAAWDAFAWRSTAMNCIDIYLSGDTRQAVELQAPQGSLWAQITTIMQDTIFAHPCCDNYGRIFAEIDTALVPLASRAAFPVVMTLSKDDYEKTSITRVTVPKTSRVDLSGVAINSSVGSAIFSLADGHVFGRFGKVVVLDQLLLSTQAQANQLAADYKAQQNKAYSFEITNGTNNRLIGVCPHQFVAVSIDAADTLRNIPYYGNLIPRRVTWAHNPETGAWSSSWGCDPETSGALFINGDIPVVDDSGLTLDSWQPPSFPPFSFSPLIVPPPAIIPPATAWVGSTIAILFSGLGLWHTSLLSPGIWTNDTPAFTETELSSLLHFELFRASGRAYLASALQIWNTVLGTGTKTLLGSEAFFKSAFYQASSSNFAIASIGCDQETGRVAVWTGGAWSDVTWRQSNLYLGGEGGALTKTAQIRENGQGNFPPMTPIGRMTNYAGKWYSSQDGFNTNIRIRRANDGLTAVENTLGLPYGESAYHNHAQVADYIYQGAHRITALGTSSAAMGISFPTFSNYQVVDCDPTGQYLLAAADTGHNTPRYSGDFGATWANVSVLPGVTSIYARSSRVLNLGDANRWIYSASDTLDRGSDEINKFRIFYTGDAGNSWSEITGDLATKLPITATAKEIRAA